MTVLKTRTSSITLLVPVFYLFGFLSLPAPVFSDDSQYQRLPPGKGRDQVLENCTACHSATIILQNHMSMKQWDQTLTWMQEKHGLLDLEPKLRKTILQYLSTHQGAKKLSPQLQDSMGHKYTYQPNPLYKH